MIFLRNLSLKKSVGMNICDENHDQEPELTTLLAHTHAINFYTLMHISKVNSKLC